MWELDVNVGWGVSNGDNGVSELKKFRVFVICEEVILEFDGVCGGMKKEWDWFFGEGWKLLILMWDMDDWI